MHSICRLAPLLACMHSYGKLFPTPRVQDDMDVMFDNALAYNSPDTVYHKQARSLKAVAAKMVELAKQGVTDFR